MLVFRPGQRDALDECQRTSRLAAHGLFWYIGILYCTRSSTQGQGPASDALLAVDVDSGLSAAPDGGGTVVAIGGHTILCCLRLWSVVDWRALWMTLIRRWLLGALTRVLAEVRAHPVACAHSPFHMDQH